MVRYPELRGASGLSSDQSPHCYEAGVHDYRQWTLTSPDARKHVCVIGDRLSFGLEPQVSKTKGCVIVFPLE